MAETRKMFAQTIEWAGLKLTQRDTKPFGHLTPHQHFEMDLPEGLGRAHLDVYQWGGTLVTRVLNFSTGETAWYDVAFVDRGAA